jgi:hypothetical protein
MPLVKTRSDDSTTKNPQHPAGAIAASINRIAIGRDGLKVPRHGTPGTPPSFEHTHVSGPAAFETPSCARAPVRPLTPPSARAFFEQQQFSPHFVPQPQQASEPPPEPCDAVVGTIAISIAAARSDSQRLAKRALALTGYPRNSHFITSSSKSCRLASQRIQNFVRFIPVESGESIVPIVRILASQTRLTVDGC